MPLVPYAQARQPVPPLPPRPPQSMPLALVFSFFSFSITVRTMPRLHQQVMCLPVVSCYCSPVPYPKRLCHTLLQSKTYGHTHQCQKLLDSHCSFHSCTLHLSGERPFQASMLMRETLRWLREAHPYWNRSGGTDHIWLLIHDEGPCFVPK